MPIQCRLYLSLTPLLPLAEAAAATFCVGTGDELRAALNAASGNGEDDLIRVRAGTYNATMNAVAFAYSSSEANALVVEGGWQLGGGPGTCGARIDDPTLTTLDGSNVRRVLLVYGFAGAGNFTLRNFTVRNGVSSSGAGGLQVGGGTGYAGDVLVERLVVHSNTGTIGGGMDGGSDGGRFVLSNSLIRDNQCDSAYCGAVLTINDHGGSGLPLPALDLSGLPRLNGAFYDIGAYESQARLFADGFETAP